MFAFTTPLIGGLLIGTASVVMLLFLGRITGISGIVWSAITAQPDNAWRWLFLLGLLLGPLLYHTVSGVPYPVPSGLQWWHALIGGLLVGFGVNLGGGCTSGHGVSGLGRLSLRSLVATVTFMATGIVTVFILRHVVGGG